MAQLILPPQKFNYKDIIDQFPTNGSPKKKVFFQAELRSITGGNASFGVIAYPAWKDGSKWVVGAKVEGVDTGAKPKMEPFTKPIAFANNEIILSISLSKKKKKKKKNKNKDPRKGRWSEFMKMAKKTCKDPALLEKSELIFETRISENPHLEYDVNLTIGSNTITVATKPSPPALPES